MARSPSHGAGTAQGGGPSRTLLRSLPVAALAVRIHSGILRLADPAPGASRGRESLPEMTRDSVRPGSPTIAPYRPYLTRIPWSVKRIPWPESIAGMWQPMQSSAGETGQTRRAPARWQARQAATLRGPVGRGVSMRVVTVDAARRPVASQLPSAGQALVAVLASSDSVQTSPK
jgi:hypothetical protein